MSRVSQLPRLGVALDALPMPTLDERLDWATAHGFVGVELSATGAPPPHVHAPTVSTSERLRLRDRLAAGGFESLAVRAPHQQTFDLSLVSPSAAIRRASVSEIWSVCRLVEALGGERSSPAGTVLVRTGNAPLGVGDAEQYGFLAECLQTLDRMAGDHNVVIGLLNHDLFARPHDYDRLDALRLRHTGIALDLAALPQGAGGLAAFLRERGAPRLVHRLVHLRVESDDPDVGSALLARSGYAGMVCLADADAAPPTALIARFAAWSRALSEDVPDV